jgi:predicted SprT family Zn-dependent metalloprotease
MEKHGLVEKGWRVEITKHKTIFGQCDFSRRIIMLSAPLVLVNEVEVVLDTIRHEIAHALVGPFNNHNIIWKRKCLEIGGNGKARFNPKRDSVKMADSPFVGLCSKCGLQIPRYRKTHTIEAKMGTHRSCGGDVKFFRSSDVKFLLNGGDAIHILS